MTSRAVHIQLYLPHSEPTPQVFQILDEELGRVGFSASPKVYATFDKRPEQPSLEGFVTHSSRRGHIPGAAYQFAYEMPPLLIGRPDYEAMCRCRRMDVLVTPLREFSRSKYKPGSYLSFRCSASPSPACNLQYYDFTRRRYSVEWMTGLAVLSGLQRAFLSLHRRLGAFETECQDMDEDREPFHFVGEEIVSFMPIPEDPVLIPVETFD